MDDLSDEDIDAILDPDAWRPPPHLTHLRWAPERWAQARHVRTGDLICEPVAGWMYVAWAVNRAHRGDIGYILITKHGGWGHGPRPEAPGEILVHAYNPDELVCRRRCLTPRKER